MIPRNKDARAQVHEEGSKAGGGVQLPRVRGQVTKSVGVVDVDDEF